MRPWHEVVVSRLTFALTNRFTKRRRYQDAGVPLYWIIDADARQAEVWTPGDDYPVVERTRLAWHPDGTAEPFTLELSHLLQPV